MKDPYEVREHVNNEVLTVEYTKPKFWHRCMANFVDFFIMLVTFLLLFIGARAIVQSTPSYKTSMTRLGEMQIASGLYREAESASTTTSNIDIVYYADTYLTVYGKEYEVVDQPVSKNGVLVKAIDTFIKFCQENSSEERYLELVDYYKTARLEPTFNGVHYYLEEGDDVVINTTLSEDSTKAKEYYNNIFKPFIEKKCIPFLAVNVPEYRELNKVDYRCLLFIELPSSYLLAGILTYFIPPLFFRRGRKTLGKALYHIGLIDTRLLSPAFPRFLARFAIFYFAELILSLFTLGIPYIISFSLMAFSKKKQGFPDYMLRLYEIDTSKANIYMDYVEAATKNELHGKPVDFKMEEPL